MSEPRIENELRVAFNDQLEAWAKDDPNPVNRELAEVEIQRRKNAALAERSAKSYVPPMKDEAAKPSNDAIYIADCIVSKLPIRPFDPRTEVSADARRIVTHMWIIFVLLPLILGLLYELLK